MWAVALPFLWNRLNPALLLSDGPETGLLRGEKGFGVACQSHLAPITEGLATRAEGRGQASPSPEAGSLVLPARLHALGSVIRALLSRLKGGFSYFQVRFSGPPQRCPR